ncbi:MAG: circadian clock KaiB family protein [Phycisphaerae bacterium]|nr:circadian clock KaiB family protein [Phycisphaerae bacterium]
MSQPPRAKRSPGKGQRGHYVLRLFTAGDGSNSKQAMVNLRRLCREHLSGRCTIEVVDVARDFQAAVRDNILVTPALILIAPRPRVMILGTLGDLQKVLVALRLPGREA